MENNLQFDLQYCRHMPLNKIYETENFGQKHEKQWNSEVENYLEKKSNTKSKRKNLKI